MAGLLAVAGEFVLKLNFSPETLYGGLNCYCLGRVDQLGSRLDAENVALGSSLGY